MRIAVFPGSFDPVTRGHLDLIERAAKLFDRVIVGVLVNERKTPVFSDEERAALIEKAAKQLGNVSALCFRGLTVDFVRQTGACAVVRGIRTYADFEYENQMAQLNEKLLPGLETVYLQAKPEYAAFSSSAVREIGAFGGDPSFLVPDAIRDEVIARVVKR